MCIVVTCSDKVALISPSIHNNGSTYINSGANFHCHVVTMKMLSFEEKELMPLHSLRLEEMPTIYIMHDVT